MLIHTPVLEVTVLPEIGGKIGQIRHRPSGIDLLVPPRRRYRTLPTDDPWVGYDTSGMDDCFPNLDEGPYPVDPWRGRKLPQMGEWVRGAWQAISANDREVTLERAGLLLPYVARKRIHLAHDTTLRVTYELRNTSSDGFRYIWSAHPLMLAGDSFSLHLNGRDLPVKTFPDRGKTGHWPLFDGRDLSAEWVPYGTTLKAFVCGMTEGWCELVTCGRRLRIEFDPTFSPVLGLWFNNYGFAGGGQEPFRCIAVEPCTSATDVLDALPASDYPILAAGSAATWWFALRVE